MHAYAAEDPVFLAMNQRGQRETNGELGDFCVQCHAPVAVHVGLRALRARLAGHGALLPRAAVGARASEASGHHGGPFLRCTMNSRYVL